MTFIMLFPRLFFRLLFDLKKNQNRFLVWTFVNFQFFSFFSSFFLVFFLFFPVFSSFFRFFLNLNINLFKLFLLFKYLSFRLNFFFNFFFKLIFFLFFSHFRRQRCCQLWRKEEPNKMAVVEWVFSLLNFFLLKIFS